MRSANGGCLFVLFFFALAAFTCGFRVSANTVADLSLPRKCRYDSTSVSSSATLTFSAIWLFKAVSRRCLATVFSRYFLFGCRRF